MLKKILLLALASMAASTAAVAESFDLDGDGAGEPSLVRFRDGTFFLDTVGGKKASVACGLPGDVPLPGKYLPGPLSQLAVWNPSKGRWTVCGGADKDFGEPGDIPVPADYNGDGLIDFAVFRPGSGQWLVLTNSSGGSPESSLSFSLGSAGDIPVPGDYDGDGIEDPAVYRRGHGTDISRWIVRQSQNGLFEYGYGFAGDVPVPGDYTGDGKTDFAIWRRHEGTWYIKVAEGTAHDVDVLPFGTEADLPAPTDADGDGKTDLVFYRPKASKWFVSTSGGGDRFTVGGGAPGDRLANNALSSLIDRKAPGDLDGDRVTDLAVVRAAAKNGLDFLSNSGPKITFGKKGDRAGFGDYDGNGLSDLTTITSDKGVLVWRLRLTRGGGVKPVQMVITWGVAASTPLAGDFDGDGKTDLASVAPLPSGVFEWQLLLTGKNPSPPIRFGDTESTPITGDVDGDGRSDFIVVDDLGSSLRGHVLTSAKLENTLHFFGKSGDTAAAADFDGDGDAELAAIRTGAEALQISADGLTPFDWGKPGDQLLFGTTSGLFGVGAEAWRVINGQGVFIIRDRLGEPVSKPFGVVGDRALDPIRFISTAGLKAPSAPAPGTSGGGSNSGSGNGKKLRCASRSSVGSQSSGFVWKPVSESAGKLVVLFPRSFAGKIDKVALVQTSSSGDRVLETLKFRGLTNGGRPTFDAKKSGGSYPKNVVLVRQTHNGSYSCITVGSPGSRHD